MKEYKYKINGNTYNVGIGDIVDNVAEVLVNGMPYKVELEKKQGPVSIVSAPRPSAAPRTATGEKVVSKPNVSAGGFQIKAPLPGTILSINVKVGDTVSSSDTVLMLEAMKMETAISARMSGTVEKILISEGDTVKGGQLLLTIK